MDPESKNTGLRNAAFRGYADYMETAAFRSAFDELIHKATSTRTAILCSETLWWRCHRRLIADASVLLARMPVEHILVGAVRPHVLTEGVHATESGLRYAAPD